MRCPKCHYLSFEPESRCRNCGYDFSLQADLPVKATDTPSPFDDIDLHPSETRAAAPTPITLGPIRLDRPEPVIPASPRPAADKGDKLPGAAGATAGSGTSAAVSATTGVAVAERVVAGPRRREPVRRPAPVAVSTSELPLFVRGLQNAPIETPSEADDHQLAVPPAPPPLAVRRSTPDPAQMRQKYQAPEQTWRKPVSDLIRPVERKLESEPADPARGADRDLLQILDRPEPPRSAEQPRRAEAPQPTGESDALPAIPATERLIAAVVDGSLLAGINAGVMWFTLRLCGLQLANLGALPVIPLAAFLLLVDAGYLLLFTAASGQTVGKMAAGIRVVSAEPGAESSDRLTLSQAALRTILSFPSVLALGAGFVPALLGEGRAIHDRIADTRVVRA